MKAIIVKILTLIMLLELSISCSNSDQDNQYRFNGKELKKLIDGYLNYEDSSNPAAGIIFNYSEPSLIKLNALKIDSTTSLNKKLYTVLLEAENPAFNKFIIIDDSMNVLLKDNSLNGYLFAEFRTVEGNQFYIITESFRSKGKFNLERTTFYSLEQNSPAIIFRALTGYSENDKRISAQIKSFTDSVLTLSYSKQNLPLFNLPEEKFTFNAADNKYQSEENYLYNFVLNSINTYNSEDELSEIIDRNSYQIILSSDFSKPEEDTYTERNYNIRVSESWKEFKEFGITEHLSQSLTGSLFRNENLGANISVSKIPEDQQAEYYIEYELKNTDEFSHPVKYSDIHESGRSYIIFYEFTCGNDKYLLILDAPKFTYDKYREEYLQIIKSFKAEC